MIEWDKHSITLESYSQTMHDCESLLLLLVENVSGSGYSLLSSLALPKRIFQWKERSEGAFVKRKRELSGTFLSKFSNTSELVTLATFEVNAYISIYNETLQAQRGGGK
jgi:hypothetical protein